jgi:hypothetical protein
VEPVAKALFANLFFYLFETARFDPRGTLRFPRRHAPSGVSSVSISRWE